MTARGVDASRCQTAPVLRRLVAVNAVSAVVVTAALLVACGGDDAAEPEATLSPAAAAGFDVFSDNGCVSCHGANGQGDIGPPLTELYGTEVSLDDGSTVVADDAYLRRAIAEPDAERVDGYEVAMPVNGLDDAEIESLIEWIRKIGPATGS